MTETLPRIDLPRELLLLAPDDPTPIRVEVRTDPLRPWEVIQSEEYATVAEATARHESLLRKRTDACRQSFPHYPCPTDHDADRRFVVFNQDRAVFLAGLYEETR